MMKIVSESSVAAGVRRIEAYTGARVEEMLDAFQDTMRDLKALFNNAPDLSGIAIRKYIEEKRRSEETGGRFHERERSTTERETSTEYPRGERYEGNQVLCSHDTRRYQSRISLSNCAGKLQKTSFFVAGTVFEGKPMLTVICFDNKVGGGVKKRKMGKKEAKKMKEGGGGQHPFSATFGGKNPGRVKVEEEKGTEGEIK